MAYQSPSNFTKFEKYLNIHLVVRIPLSKIKIDILKSKILNIHRAAEASYILFKDANFPSRENIEALAQNLTKED